MVVSVVDRECASSHIRPFSPYRDLSDLASLVEIAFADELAITGSQMVRDLRQMAVWGAMLRVAHAFLPTLSGFVWQEGARLVGNVTLMREKGPDVWTLSNVAVMPEFRGKHIAGQLVDRAVSHVRRQKGKRVLLQVRADNEVAVALYRHRGFVRFDCLHELDLHSHGWPTIVGSPGCGLRGVRLSEGRRLCDLVSRATPREALRVRPLKPDQFRRGLLWHLAQSWKLLSGGQESTETVAERKGELVAYGRVTVRAWRGPHDLWLHVLPSERGIWESSLTQELLRSIGHARRYSVRANVSQSHPEALECLKDLGFRTLRVLDQMVLEL